MKRKKGTVVYGAGLKRVELPLAEEVYEVEGRFHTIEGLTTLIETLINSGQMLSGARNGLGKVKERISPDGYGEDPAKYLGVLINAAQGVARRSPTYLDKQYEGE